MALHPLKIIALALWAVVVAQPATACFGPKLFLGIPDDLRGEVMASVVVVYIKEKTGIDTERVDLAGRNAVSEIRAEKLDYGFAEQSVEGLSTVLQVDGLPQLVSGPRIHNDLQFTTVAPALLKLQKRLQPEHIEQIYRQAEKGELPMAAARKFLLQQRWI